MRKNGFFGIGCLGMKSKDNYGTLCRTAQIFGADFIFLIDSKFKVQRTDTMKSWRHVPIYEYDDFDDFLAHKPYDCKLIGIEQAESATMLTDFKHPKQVCYLLGSEQHGLSEQAINACDGIIVIPGERSLNVSTAGSIVLYDRITK